MPKLKPIEYPDVDWHAQQIAHQTVYDLEGARERIESIQASYSCTWEEAINCIRRGGNMPLWDFEKDKEDTRHRPVGQVHKIGNVEFNIQAVDHKSFAEIVDAHLCRCPFVFKSEPCGYTGIGHGKCDKTRASCIAFGNESHFVGAPHIQMASHPINFVSLAGDDSLGLTYNGGQMYSPTGSYGTGAYSQDVLPGTPVTPFIPEGYKLVRDTPKPKAPKPKPKVKYKPGQRKVIFKGSNDE